MPLWKLTPTGVPSDRWARSTFRRWAVVRAPDEAAARAHASLRFDLAPASPPASGPLGSPWEQAELVRCTRVEGAEDEETGPTAILDPPGYD